MQQMYKYPRTQHIESSRLQPGDEDLDAIPFSQISSEYLVIEEKVDGANAGISFSEEGKLLLQSRGHYLTGGFRERHFSLFKQWANVFAQPLFEVLGSRYVLYGEWLYAKHTIFYTDLTHYFLEFDIYDKAEKFFLDTPSRKKLREGLPFIIPVKVLYEGEVKKLKELVDLVGVSLFIRNQHFELLSQVCQSLKLKENLVKQETDPSPLMEGLYVKVEKDGRVVRRLKWIRPSFMTSVIQSNSHWLDRPIIPNQLAKGIDIFNFS